MLTFLTIHFGSILLLLVWMVIENLIKKGDIDILVTIRTEAYKHGLPMRAMWVTILVLPELVLLIAVLNVITAILKAIFE